MLGFGAISSLPIGGLPEWRVWFNAYVTLTGVEGFYTRLYAATQEYISLSTDTPANQPFLGTLRQTITFERSIIGGTGFTELSQGWGEVELHNLEADYDYLASGYAVDGQEITLKVGDPSGAYNSFYPMGVFILTDMTIGEEVARFGMRDRSYRLDVPAQTQVYAGTGDLEGQSDLAGKRKPEVYGQVNNVTPARVIPAEMVFQVASRAVNAISAVYEDGYPLTGPDADYATSALLRAAGIAAGHYATCKAEGLFRIGHAANGLVTCDVQGDAFGSYVNTTGTIIRRLVTRAAGLADPTDLDTVAFANLETDQPAVVGYYLDPNSNKTVAEAVRDLMSGIGGTAGFTRLGKYQVLRFTAPAGPNAAEYDQVEIVEIEREKLPESINPPPWRERVAYDRNWTIITNPVPGLAETNPARTAYLAQPYRTAATPDASGTAIRVNHPLAQDPAPSEAYFRDQADALAEASRLLALYNAGYGLYRVVVKDHPFVHDIGQCIFVTYPRWNLTEGRQLRIVSARESTDSNAVELRAFG